ncbi:GWxTD domain-containing protein [candidate division KSB1 bacterium]
MKKILSLSVILTSLVIISFFNLHGDTIDKKLNLNLLTVGVYDLPTEEKGVNKLYVGIRAPYSFFRFIKKDKVFSAEYEFAVEVYNKKNDIRKNSIMQENIEVEEFEETNSDEDLVIKEMFFNVPPGAYDLRLVITDLDTKKSITQRKKVTLKDYWDNKLGIGNAVFYSEGDVNYDGGKKIIIPNPYITLDYSESLVIKYMFFNNNTGKVTLNTQIVPEYYEDEPVYTNREDINIKQYVTDRMIVLNPRDLHAGPYILYINLEAKNGKDYRKIPFSIKWDNYPVLQRDIDVVIEQMKYIMTDEELENVSSLSENEKKAFFEGIWKRIVPDTTFNLENVVDEYFGRVDYADQHYTDEENEGWLSGRGRTWILYGQPDNIIERHNLRPPYETWEYRNINKKFIFWDEFSTGIFKLKSAYDLKK